MDLPAYGHLDHLQDLEDTPATVPADGEGPVWNGTTFVWGAVGGAATLRRLVDDAFRLGTMAPQAVYDPATHRTYFPYREATGNTDVYIVYVNHATGELVGPEKVADWPIDAGNAHGDPVIAVGADGHLHVIFGSHNSAHHHAMSNEPHDISGWTVRQLPGNGTYPCIEVAPNGDLYVSDRASAADGSSGHDTQTFPSHAQASLYRSVDNGDSWTRREIIDTDGHPDSHSDVYVHTLKWVDGLLRMSWFIATGSSHGETVRNVYHGAYSWADQEWSTLDGTSLGAVVEWADHSDVLVFEGTPVTRIRDLIVDDTMHISFGHTVDGVRRIHVSTWDGSWSTVNTGLASPQGSTALARYGPLIVGLFTVQPDGQDYADLDVYVSDGGGVWWRHGTVLDGPGADYVIPVPGGGPWWAVGQTAGDAQPVSAVVGQTAVSPHGDEHHTGDHDHDDVYSPVGHDHGTRWVPLANGDPDDPAYLFTPEGDGLLVEAQW